MDLPLTFTLKLTNFDHGFRTDAVYYNRGVSDVTGHSDGTLVSPEYSGFDGLDELIYVERVTRRLNFQI